MSIVFFSEYHAIGKSDPRFLPRGMVFGRISREIRPNIPGDSTFE